MKAITTRDEFVQLAELRLSDAKLLLEGGNWDGAYYLAGYAIECALKARIIARLMKANVYPDQKDASAFYQHGLDKLLSLAALDEELKSEADVKEHWEILEGWSEQNRYRLGIPEVTVKEMIVAIEEGVLPWIRSRW